MKFSLLLILLPVLGFAGSKGEEAEKKISRQFTTQTNGYLDISNRYGNIDVAIGASNQIKIDVVITAEASSVKKAQEAVERINITFEESTNRVAARTEVENNTSWSSWFDNSNVSLKINYTVMVPADIFLQLANKYGNIYVETTNRDLRIDLDYGDIRLGNINAKLSLDMSYSDGAISGIQNGDLSLSYSDLEMEDADALQVDMKYTDLVMGSADRLKVVSSYSDLQGNDVDEVSYSGKYDDLTFERVKSIEAESAYSGMQVSGLSTNGRFEMRYGELNVDNIGMGFTRMDINTSYTGVVLGFEEAATFSIDAQNNYCDISHHGLKVTEDIQRAGSSTLKATKGTGGGMVFVRMNYGELSIQ
jgi:hypothetical protein